MRSRLVVGCALVLAVSVHAFAQDAFEANPSLAELSADDAYARNSEEALRTAGIGWATSIRVDDAGRVLVASDASYVPHGFPLVARLDADGRLDATFGEAGVAAIPVWGWLGRGLELDAAGRIVVTGSFYDAHTHRGEPGDTGRDYCAARLLADGSLDAAFSGDGLLELEPASGLYGLGLVRASGGDGAMLAAAARDGPAYDTPVGPRSATIVGLVRIAADGTIDATYGGGFAEIAPEWFADYSVTAFDVDSAGRAVVAMKPLYASWPYTTVQHLDAAGDIDTSLWSAGYPYGGENFGASQVAFDGAGRVVGLGDGGLSRTLPGGAPDPTYSDDGFAWSLEAAGFYGGTRGYLELLRAMRSDPNYDPLPWTGHLAVATHADRWVLAKVVPAYDAKGRRIWAIRIQAIDPGDPGAIVSATCRPPGKRSGGVAALAITADGTTAYALSYGFVVRVDLMTRRSLPLPDLRVKWLGWPHARNLGGGRYRVTARVRIRNASRHDVTAAYGVVGFAPGEYDLALAEVPRSATGYPPPFRVRGRSSVVRRFTWEGKYDPGLAGERLSVRIACELPDANSDDNTATSRQMIPLYLPR